MADAALGATRRGGLTAVTAFGGLGLVVVPIFGLTVLTIFAILTVFTVLAVLAVLAVLTVALLGAILLTALRRLVAALLLTGGIAVLSLTRGLSLSLGILGTGRAVSLTTVVIEAVSASGALTLARLSALALSFGAGGLILYIHCVISFHICVF
jgi:hypothetical protein